MNLPIVLAGCACLCQGPSSTEEAYRYATAVFVARVDSLAFAARRAGQSTPARGVDHQVYVRLERAWKWPGGGAPPARAVLANWDGPACGAYFRSGERWLVFAVWDSAAGAWRTRQCSGSEVVGNWEGARFRDHPETAERLAWLTTHAPRPRRPAS